MRNRNFVTGLHGALASSKKIIFLGFGFEPQNMEFLFDYSLSHDPDVIAATTGMPETSRAAVLRLLKRQTGIEDDSLISILDMRCFQFVRDYALFLQS